MKSQSIYLTYKLNYRDIEELLAKHGSQVNHATIHCWMLEYATQLEATFGNGKKRGDFGLLRMGEIYIKVKALWFDLYHTVDNNSDLITAL